MLLFCLYLILSLDSITKVVFYVAVAITVILGLYSLFHLVEMKKPDVNTAKKLIKYSLIGWLLVAFIPNKQTGLILGAVYIGQETLESIASNELVRDSVEILKLEVKEYLNSKKQE